MHNTKLSEMSFKVEYICQTTIQTAPTKIEGTTKCMKLQHMIQGFTKRREVSREAKITRANQYQSTVFTESEDCSPELGKRR